MTVDKRKQKKAKKREDKIKKAKLMATQSKNSGMSVAQKKFGKIQIAIVLLLAAAGAMFIILNV